MHKKTAALLSAVLLLSACGGGSDAEPDAAGNDAPPAPYEPIEVRGGLATEATEIVITGDKVWWMVAGSVIGVDIDAVAPGESAELGNTFDLAGYTRTGVEGKSIVAANNSVWAIDVETAKRIDPDSASDEATTPTAEVDLPYGESSSYRIELPVAATADAVWTMGPTAEHVNMSHPNNEASTGPQVVVSRIDTETNTLITTGIDNNPDERQDVSTSNTGEMLADGDRVYVADTEGVSVLDAADGSIIASARDDEVAPPEGRFTDSMSALAATENELIVFTYSTIETELTARFLDKETLELLGSAVVDSSGSRIAPGSQFAFVDGALWTPGREGLLKITPPSLPLEDGATIAATVAVTEERMEAEIEVPNSVGLGYLVSVDNKLWAPSGVGLWTFDPARL